MSFSPIQYPHHTQGLEEDAIHLWLFPLSLLGKGKQWFYSNRVGIDT
jgi:hypothetical protein